MWLFLLVVVKMIYFLCFCKNSMWTEGSLQSVTSKNCKMQVSVSAVSPPAIILSTWGPGMQHVASNRHLIWAYLFEDGTLGSGVESRQRSNQVEPWSGQGRGWSTPQARTEAPPPEPETAQSGSSSGPGLTGFHAFLKYLFNPSSVHRYFLCFISVNSSQSL